MIAWRGLGTLLVAGVVAALPPAWAGLGDSKHNLTASGRGPVRDPGVGGEICVFCHTPHNANPRAAQWNRELPGTVYTLYQSSTLEAVLTQPTGASRLCLSCHDGTVALGRLRVRPHTGQPGLGPLRGPAVLGTDLSDDHPVSFVYDSALALRRGELNPPAALPPAIRLDNSGQLQCTACHNPHDDPFRKFLRVDDRAAGLCVACHQKRGWTVTSHADSPATWNGSGIDPWPDSPYANVTDNGCRNCHRPHAAPRPPHLLASTEERAVCLNCHSGSVAQKNLEPEFSKFSAHPIIANEWTHALREDPVTMLRHVACADCHNPHWANSAPASPPLASGRLQGVPGVSVSGGFVAEIVNQYEVCFKCHGIRDQATPFGIVRQDNNRNVRLELSPSNPSYHPVAAIGTNPSMGGFTAGYSANSIIYCTDCHNNDQWSAGGTAPLGPHGSRYRPILEREYQMDDPQPESFQSYELCYKCHNRNYLINDQANTFPHEKHLRDANSPCAACHDAHGSRQSPHLINFMRLDRAGNSVVTPSSSNRLEYNSLGAGRGECYLTCHGKDHNPEQYP